MTDLDAWTTFGFLFVCKTVEKANQHSIANNIKGHDRLRREAEGGGWVNLASLDLDSDSNSDSDSDWGS